MKTITVHNAVIRFDIDDQLTNDIERTVKNVLYAFAHSLKSGYSVNHPEIITDAINKADIEINNK